jgi:hypothetical protein
MARDIVLALVVVEVALAMLCELKGKARMAWLGGIPLALVGSLRLAKPGSWWDVHRSSPEQRRRAAARYRRAETASLPASPAPPADADFAPIAFGGEWRASPAAEEGLSRPRARRRRGARA